MNMIISIVLVILFPLISFTVLKVILGEDINKDKSDKHELYVVYSTYVDDFQFHCTCAVKKTTKIKRYTNTKKIEFWKDENGDIVLLGVDQISDGAVEKL